MHDPKEIEENRIEVAKKYAQARRAFIVDLFLLAKEGLIFNQLADIFHAGTVDVAKRAKRNDGGRYFAMNFLLRKACCDYPGGLEYYGNGDIEHLEKSNQVYERRLFRIKGCGRFRVA